MRSSSQQLCILTEWTRKSIFTLLSNTLTKTAAGNDQEYRLFLLFAEDIAGVFVLKTPFFFNCCFRYITVEELEQALREYGMHDGRDINEIINEVDTDHVSDAITRLQLISF